jgi:hypothetical protein
MVELRPPRTGWADLQAAAARARQATEELRREGQYVRFLRSVFVPEEDACFFLFEGSSARSVRAAVARAQLAAVHVDEALRLDHQEGEIS